MKFIPRILLATIVLGGIGAWFWLHWLESSYEAPYSQIEDGLYVGSAVKEPPSGTEAVVNLCGQKDRYPMDACLWEPILEGGKDPDVEWLEKVVEFIHAQRRAGRQTYIHCLAGMNRSGMVVTAYLMYEHHWSRDRALAFVRSHRPQVQPNSGLMRLLGKWQKRLQERRQTLRN